MLDICLAFRISSEEFQNLKKEYGRLCYHAMHQLKRKNHHNNYTDDTDDIIQELHLSMIRAGSYYKRQVFIEKSFTMARKYIKDDFLMLLWLQLRDLWENRTRHGANRQKFGPHQEKMLQKLVAGVVPNSSRPSKKAPLKIDSKFSTYCKAIVWNSLKNMGKKITREKSIRTGQISLSEFDYLAI